jgi:hypothetical protein
MPWEIIAPALANASLTASITTVVILVIVQQAITSGARRLEGTFLQAEETHRQALANEGQRFQSTLKQAEDAFSKTLQMTSEIDLDLRKIRIVAYEELWQKTGDVPKWPKATDMTYKRLEELSESMKHWYFTKGGMYLSSTARQTYGSVQDAIWEVLLLDQVKQERHKPVTDEHYELVRTKCSSLRTELTKDILSRRAAPL